jgi:hypothetical protein
MTISDKIKNNRDRRKQYIAWFCATLAMPLTAVPMIKGLIPNINLDGFTAIALFVCWGFASSVLWRHFIHKGE